MPRGDRPMKRELQALGLTVILLLSMLVFAQPTAAVLSTVDGPDEVRQPDRVAFDTSVQIREDERVPIESFDLVIETEEGDTVTVTFAPDGTIESVQASGNASDRINVSMLEETLVVNRTDENADFGYGYLSGTNERTGENRSFGYGYGYGYGYGAQPTFGFDISFSSAAFEPGSYTARLSVNTDGEGDAFASNVHSFEVLPALAPATVDVKPETLNKGSNGKWVTAYIELPEHNVTDIDIGTVELNGVPAVNDPQYGFVSDPAIKDRDGDGNVELMVKFPRDAVADTLETGDNVTVTVTGDVGDTSFRATDTIRVIDKGGGNPGLVDRAKGAVDQAVDAAADSPPGQAIRDLVGNAADAKGDNASDKAKGDDASDDAKTNGQGEDHRGGSASRGGGH